MKDKENVKMPVWAKLLLGLGCFALAAFTVAVILL